MTATPISLTGRLSLEDLLDIHRYHSRIVIRTSIRILMAAVSLGIAALLVFAGRKTGFTTSTYLFLGLCAYFPFGWWLEKRLSVSSAYRRAPEKFIEHTATFTSESISLSSPKAETRLAWDQIGFITSTPRGLLFLLPPHGVWFWLPSRLFLGNSYKEAILELATEHKITIKTMA
jgi:hypothetical protein